MDMHKLTTKFLATDSSLKAINFNSFEVGKQYYFEQVVIEYHCLYDYLLQVIAKTDEEVVFKEIYERHSDNCIYPGEWCIADGNITTYTRSDIESGFINGDMKAVFYE